MNNGAISADRTAGVLIRARTARSLGV